MAKPASPSTSRAKTTQASARAASQATTATADTVATAAARGAEAQEIQQFAAAQHAQHAQDTAQATFLEMSQGPLYDYLQKLTVQQAAGDETAWKTGDKEINLIGIRGVVIGHAGSSGGSDYNDTLHTCRLVDGIREVQSFRASTDAGRFSDPEKLILGYHDHAGSFVGMSLLADGFYRDAFRRGEVAHGEFGLVQQGLVRLQADRHDDDGTGDHDPPITAHPVLLAGPRLQIQFHRGAEANRVGVSRAGCQAIHPQDWVPFQRVLAEAPRSQDAREGGQGFSYLLLDGAKLPAPDSDFKALRRSEVDQRTVFQHAHAAEGAGDADPARGDLDSGLDSRASRQGDLALVRTPGTGATSKRASRFDDWLRS
ncbi:MAG: hypothetical protein ABIJ09_06665 [Pseudomonadota bacterium]